MRKQSEEKERDRFEAKQSKQIELHSNVEQHCLNMAKKITNRHLCVVLVIAKKLPHIEVSLIALCQCKQRQKLGIQFAVQFKWLM